MTNNSFKLKTYFEFLLLIKLPLLILIFIIKRNFYKNFKLKSVSNYKAFYIRVRLKPFVAIMVKCSVLIKTEPH